MQMYLKTEKKLVKYETLVLPEMKKLPLAL